ncbi:MAG: DUF4349 domain-containing protein [Chloroflexi bacterium]|nr:DUF4349 domain-containing protein [Chloroflexota bacterium]
MAGNQIPPEELERTLKAHFESEATRLRAPDDLWERIQARIQEAQGEGRLAAAWRRLRSPRRWGLAPVSVGAVALLVAVSAAWLVTASPWDSGSGGSGGRDTALLPPEGRGFLPAATRAPAPTPTPAPWAQAPPTLTITGVPYATGFEEGARGPAGPQGPAGPAGAPGPAGASALDIAQRQVISTASVSMEVRAVDDAVARVQAIAEGLGGFVQQMSRSGRGIQQQGTIVVRVPQAQFFAALQRIGELGKVEDQNAGSQDVSEQFIDLKARLESSQREEKSLLSLLEKSTSVGDVLSIERELSRVRSEIERLQGQLNFLERRVELATLTVSLHTAVTQAPAASLTVEARNVGGSVDAVRTFVTSASGVVDEVTHSVRDGRETATVSFRVPRSQFAAAVQAVERQGDVQAKDTREGTPGAVVDTPEPDARIGAVFVEPEQKAGFWSPGRVAAVAGGSGGFVALLLVGLMLRAAYRAGWRG